VLLACCWRGGAALRRQPRRLVTDRPPEPAGRPGHPVTEAVDILCALSGLDLYLILTARGWTPERWERFVVESITHALLK
jgi:hypothetical protein